MLFLAYNRTLIKDREKTTLTVAVTSTGTTLTVKNNDAFAQNDYILIGELGTEKAEIKQVNAAVTAGTSLTVTALLFDHDIDEPVYRLAFNQIEFSHANTPTGTKTVLATEGAQLDDDYTRYEDKTHLVGYGFIRFKNSTTAYYSSYSTAIAYTGYTKKTKRKIREKIRRLLNEPDETKITDEEVNDEINLAQADIAHTHLFKGYEGTKSLSTVANQFEYSFASNVYILFDAQFDTQPLAVISNNRWQDLRWDSDTQGDPTHIGIWGNKLRVYPYPSSSADTTTLNGALTAAATTITVASTGDFQIQGRFIVDSEVISYTGKTDTTFTGCTRGIEGTTAATHLTAATVTERDILYHFQEDPADLTNENDETGIDPLLLAYAVAKDLALNLDKETLSDRLEIRFEKQLKKAKDQDTRKFMGNFGIVRQWYTIVQDNGFLIDPNQYPTNIS